MRQPNHVTDNRAKRNAQRDRDAGPAIDDGERGAAPLRRNHGACERACARNVKPCRAGQENARGHELPIAGGGAGDEIRQHEGAHGREKEFAPSDACGQRRKHG